MERQGFSTLKQRLFKDRSKSPRKASDTAAKQLAPLTSTKSSKPTRYHSYSAFDTVTNSKRDRDPPKLPSLRSSSYAVNEIKGSFSASKLNPITNSGGLKSVRDDDTGKPPPDPGQSFDRTYRRPVVKQKSYSMQTDMLNRSSDVQRSNKDLRMVKLRSVSPVKTDQLSLERKFTNDAGNYTRRFQGSAGPPGDEREDAQSFRYEFNKCRRSRSYTQTNKPVVKIRAPNLSCDNDGRVRQINQHTRKHVYRSNSHRLSNEATPNGSPESFRTFATAETARRSQQLSHVLDQRITREVPSILKTKPDNLQPRRSIRQSETHDIQSHASRRRRKSSIISESDEQNRRSQPDLYEMIKEDIELRFPGRLDRKDENSKQHRGRTVMRSSSDASGRTSKPRRKVQKSVSSVSSSSYGSKECGWARLGDEDMSSGLGRIDNNPPSTSSLNLGSPRRRLSKEVHRGDRAIELNNVNKPDRRECSTRDQSSATSKIDDASPDSSTLRATVERKKEPPDKSSFDNTSSLFDANEVLDRLLVRIYEDEYQNELARHSPKLRDRSLPNKSIRFESAHSVVENAPNIFGWRAGDLFGKRTCSASRAEDALLNSRSVRFRASTSALPGQQPTVDKTRASLVRALARENARIQDRGSSGDQRPHKSILTNGKAQSRNMSPHSNPSISSQNPHSGQIHGTLVNPYSLPRPPERISRDCQVHKPRCPDPSRSPQRLPRPPEHDQGYPGSGQGSVRGSSSGREGKVKPHEYGRDERVPSGVTISDSGCADSKSDASEQSREKDTSICGDLDRGGMDQRMIDAYASAKLSYVSTPFREITTTGRGFDKLNNLVNYMSSLDISTEKQVVPQIHKNASTNDISDETYRRGRGTRVKTGAQGATLAKHTSFSKESQATGGTEQRYYYQNRTNNQPVSLLRPKNQSCTGQDRQRRQVNQVAVAKRLSSSTCNLNALPVNSSRSPTRRKNYSYVSGQQDAASVEPDAALRTKVPAAGGDVGEVRVSKQPPPLEKLPDKTKTLKHVDNPRPASLSRLPSANPKQHQQPLQSIAQTKPPAQRSVSAHARISGIHHKLNPVSPPTTADNDLRRVVSQQMPPKISSQETPKKGSRIMRFLTRFSSTATENPEKAAKKTAPSPLESSQRSSSSTSYATSETSLRGESGKPGSPVRSFASSKTSSTNGADRRDSSWGISSGVGTEVEEDNSSTSGSLKIDGDGRLRKFSDSVGKIPISRQRATRTAYNDGMVRTTSILSSKPTVKLKQQPAYGAPKPHSFRRLEPVAPTQTQESLFRRSSSLAGVSRQSYSMTTPLYQSSSMIATRPARFIQKSINEELTEVEIETDGSNEPKTPPHGSKEALHRISGLGAVASTKKVPI